jgi:hypothetical protein
MKYFIVLLLVSVVLIARAAYVALQIKKPEKAGKYGANPKTAIIVMAVLGAVCFVAGGIGFAVKNNNQTIETAAPLKGLDNFGKDYNQYAEKLGREIIDDWSFTDEGNNSNVTAFIFDNTGATMSVYTLLEPPYYVVGATYFIETSDDQIKTVQNLSRFYALVETFESGEPEGNVINFVQKIINSAPNQITKSKNNISYYWQDEGGNMMIYIDTTKN